MGFGRYSGVAWYFLAVSKSQHQEAVQVCMDEGTLGAQWEKCHVKVPGEGAGCWWPEVIKGGYLGSLPSPPSVTGLSFWLEAPGIKHRYKVVSGVHPQWASQHKHPAPGRPCFYSGFPDLPQILISWGKQTNKKTTTQTTHMLHHEVRVCWSDWTKGSGSGFILGSRIKINMLQGMILQTLDDNDP